MSKSNEKPKATKVSKIKPDTMYISMQKIETSPSCNQMSAELDGVDIVFRAIDRPAILHEVVRSTEEAKTLLHNASTSPLTDLEVFRFDPAVIIRLTRVAKSKMILSDERFHVSYMSRVNDVELSLDWERQDGESFSLGIFVVVQPVTADRIKPGTEIARMRLYEKDV